jgi:hypothetical protein
MAPWKPVGSRYFVRESRNTIVLKNKDPNNGEEVQAYATTDAEEIEAGDLPEQSFGGSREHDSQSREMDTCIPGLDQCSAEEEQDVAFVDTVWSSVFGPWEGIVENIGGTVGLAIAERRFSVGKDSESVEWKAF